MSTSDDPTTFTIGELARRTGTTVRTLHHYDDLGLLRPLAGGRGERRLYGPAELHRLQRILSLRGLGFSLDEIGAALDDPEHAPLALVERHVARLDEELDAARRLRDRLEAIASSLRSAAAPAVDDLLGAIETMNEMERFKEHYTAEQLEYLEQRARDVGAERMASVQDDWRDLFAAFRDAHERDLDPSSDEVQALAARHRALIDEFTGGREDVREALGRANAANPDATRAFGMGDALSEYVRRATEA